MLNNNPNPDSSEVISVIEASPQTSPTPTNISPESSLVLPSNNKARADDHPFLGTKKDRKPEYINFDDEEQRKFIFSDSPSGSSENKNHSKYLYGKILEETKKEIVKYIEKIEGTDGDALESVQLRVRSPLRTMLTARIVLNNNAQGINISNFLTSDFCKQNSITAVTLLLPNDEKRGIRGRIDEDGTKIYEVANGSYQMNLTWYVDGKECKIKINIHDNGSVEFVERNGVTKEQLAANKVKVGRQYEAEPLDKALASQLEQESSETVEVLTKMTSMKPPAQLQASAAQGK